jgi:hypothetical protein
VVAGLLGPARTNKMQQDSLLISALHCRLRIKPKLQKHLEETKVKTLLFLELHKASLSSRVANNNRYTPMLKARPRLRIKPKLQKHLEETKVKTLLFLELRKASLSNKVTNNKRRTPLLKVRLFKSKLQTCLEEIWF